MIDVKRKVTLGNLKQKIHIKGNDINNPVLLFLHGGPGVANRHAVMTTNNDLLDYFTIVAWDQRGTCGSYFHCKKETLTIAQVSKDASELVNYLCAQFKKKKIFVIGGSWGSLLGINLIKNYPDKIAAFVGFGQVVNGYLNEEISYDFALNEAKKAKDNKAIKKLNKIGRPVNGSYKRVFKDMMIQRKIMMKYGGYSKDKDKRNYFDAMIKPMLKSKEYSLLDLYGYIKGYKYCLTNMWREVGMIDFPKTHTAFKVPLFIFDGRLDKNTPSELVEDWFNKIKAPTKELHWFNNAGHNPLFDEPVAFKKLLKEKLLKIAKEENL